MKFRTWKWTSVVYLFVALAMPAWVAAQGNQELKDNHQKYTAQQGRSPYTGAALPGTPKSARAVEGRVNDGNRDVRYTVTTIGVVPGMQSSFLPIAGAINNSGALAGYSYNGPFGGSIDFYLTAVAFTWEHGVLQPLPLLSGWPGAFAFGLNNNKMVFGVANNVDNLGNIVHTPVVWDQGSPIDLGIPAGYSTAVARGINDRGQVVGNASTVTFGFAPFIWYKGQITQLPLLPGGVNGLAYRINDRGQIVGYVDFGSSPPPGTGEYHSVLWTPQGQNYLVLDLGGLEGYFVSLAYHINNGGQVVGYSDSASAAGNIHGYLWTGGPLQDLGILPGGTFSQATWANQRGQIIGTGDRSDGNVVDFVWQNGIMTDLNDLVPAGTPLMSGGLGAGGINERGEIAETGILPDGSSVALLLTPVH
jgi:probable HAF family extracellular repeat protein